MSSLRKQQTDLFLKLTSRKIDSLQKKNEGNQFRKSRVEKNRTKLEKKELQDFMLPLIQTFYREELVNIKKVFEKNIDEQRVLIINQNESWLTEIKSALEQKNCAVITLSNLKHAFAAYYILEPDCTIIGAESHIYFGAFKIIDELKNRFTPIIIIGSAHSKQMKKSSYLLGADDYISKQNISDELNIRVQRQLAQKKITDQFIFTDELTKVYNRKYLAKIYEQLTFKVSHKQGTLSMALLDLDNYKKINDTYGHLIGDKVLVILVNELKKGIGNFDIVIRLGGDEFLILFPDTSPEQAKIKMSNVLKKFSTISFFKNTETFTCTFSSGIHEVSAEDVDLERNLVKVDQLLYEAKKERNQVLTLQTTAMS